MGIKKLFYDSVKAAFYLEIYLMERDIVVTSTENVMIPDGK